MAKINKFATSEIEGLETDSSVISPLGFHYNSQGTVFFSNGSAQSKKFVSPGKVYGNGGDSANPEGGDTLKLYPDQRIDGSTNQYVILDASAEDEIHIRAGGAEDKSDSALFIGGQKTYVKVDDNTGSVTLSSTDDNSYSTKLAITKTGKLSTRDTIEFTSIFPVTFTAVLDANTFVVDDSVGPFEGGTGWNYNVLINASDTGTLTVSIEEKIFESRTGYKVGDVFRYGPDVHGIRGYVLDLIVIDISSNSAIEHAVTLSVTAPPEAAAIIESARPAIIKYGSNRVTFALDGKIVLNGKSALYEETNNEKKSMVIQPDPTLSSRFNFYTYSDSGNLAVITTNNQTNTGLHLGDQEQYIRQTVDGNIIIRSIDRADSTATSTWKFLSSGKLASSTEEIYIKQPTSSDSNIGLFSAEGSVLTVSSGENLILQANSTSFNLTEFGNLVYPNGVTVSGVAYADSYPAFLIEPDIATVPNAGLAVYATNTNEPKLYLRPKDLSAVDFVIGTSDNRIQMDKTGNVSIIAKTGEAAVPGSTPSTDGKGIYLQAGSAGSNQGDPDYGSQGGHVYIEAGSSSRIDLYGGNVYIKSGSGFAGSGDILLNSGSRQFSFKSDGNLTFPDGTMQSTAFIDRAGTGNVTFADTTIGNVGNIQFTNGSYLTSNKIYTKNQRFDLAFEFMASPAVIGETISFDLNGMRVSGNTAVFSYKNNEYYVFEAESSNQRISFSNSTGYIKFGSSTKDGTGTQNDIELWAYGGNDSHGNVYISAGSSPTNRRWTFNSFGKLTLPGDIVGYQTYFNSNPLDERVTIQPSGSVNKPFKFITDQNAGTWQRSMMELPVAEVNKAVTLGFPHNSGPVGFIYTQGTDTGSTEFNNAFNIMANSTNVKIGVVTGGGNKVWTFAANGSMVFSDGTIQSTAYTGGGGSGTTLKESFGTLTLATGVVTHDCTTNRLFYHSSISANFTANFTNLGLAAGEATSVTLVLVQGGTARIANAVQIGGVAQTIIWQGASIAPTGNASRTDVMTFSILCTATNTYSVLGMLTSFGGV